MNKGQRNQIAKHKFAKRLKNLGLTLSKPTDYKCYRTTGTPCSCFICRDGKENKPVKHKNKIIL